jgi:hypothetical protein
LNQKFGLGENIMIREEFEGRVWTARPVKVVRDDELIVLYMMPGTEYKHPRKLNGDPVDSFLQKPWVLVDRVWSGGACLYITRPGLHYVVMHFWNLDHLTTDYWYVNLQTPYKRGKSGFDYLDQTLDIVIEKDLKSWKWKDESEVEELLVKGFYSNDEVIAIRNNGLKALIDLENRSELFSIDWAKWKPPTGWKCPSLPTNFMDNSANSSSFSG